MIVGRATGLRRGHAEGWDAAWEQLTRSARKSPKQQPAGQERDGQATQSLEPTLSAEQLQQLRTQPARISTAKPVRVRRDPGGF